MIKIIWHAIKQLLFLFYPALNNGKGGLGNLVANKVLKKNLYDEVKNYCLKKNYPFDERFMMILVQDFENPNTFNDELLIMVNGVFKKAKCTGEAGRWQDRSKVHRGFWPARWIPGYYKDSHRYSRDGKKAYIFRGMPALANITAQPMLNLDTGKIQQSAGCHIHGRRSRSDQVNKSSAGCIVPANGKKIYDIIELLRDTSVFHEKGIKMRVSLIVEEKHLFPDIIGVERL